jgi:glycosyltransferase involved in cell wall biosynthesis
LESYKGIRYLIEALPLLDGYRLKVIGKGSYDKKLHELAQKLNVSDRIDWLKDIEREELLSHFKSADVFVNLSIFEAYGITVAEALACGTPCIVATGGALEEFVGDGCVGLSYPIDINALARTIESRKRIVPRKMPDWDDITSELIRLYSR